MTEQQNEPAKEMKKEKKVKIELIRPCIIEGQIQNTGQFLVSEDEAKEFCDRKFKGPTQYYGTRENVDPLTGQPEPSVKAVEIVRAKRIS